MAADNRALTALIVVGLLVVYAAISIFTTEKGSLTGLSIGPNNAETRVCIVGGGIGGAASAHFIRQLLPKSEIMIFEKSANVGGRLFSFDYEGSTIEAGASIIHDRNKYLWSFAEQFGLEHTKRDADASWGIYNGVEFTFRTAKYKFITYFRMLWRYRLGLVRLSPLVQKLLEKFDMIYTLQNDEKAFRTPEELLTAVELYNLTQSTLTEYMEENLPANEEFHKELSEIMNRVNYGQDNNLNALAGMVSLSTTAAKLWSIKDGNQKIVSLLLKHSDAKVKTSTVVREVRKYKDSYHLINDDGSNVGPCNAVVLAVPLATAEITLPPSSVISMEKASAGSLWAMTSTVEYQVTHTTFVKGNVNASYFIPTQTKHVPKAIFTMENTSIPFTSLALQTGTKDLFKIFSREKVAEDALNAVFLPGYEVIKYFPWQAYPKFKPPERFIPFVLDEGLFYVNTIETAASALEMSAIGAKNAALLARDFLSPSEPTRSTLDHSSDL